MKTRDEISNEEATRDPIFLLQSKEIIVTNVDKYEYNPDEECLVDNDGTEVTDQMLLDNEDATERWRTESVWFTREEAEAFGKRTEYHYPEGWRVYCTNAEGELAKLLAAPA